MYIPFNVCMHERNVNVNANVTVNAHETVNAHGNAMVMVAVMVASRNAM